LVNSSGKGTAMYSMHRCHHPNARFAIVLLLFFATSACRSATSTAPATPARPAAPTAANASAPTLPDSIRWVRSSAEYVAALLETYRAATTRVEAEAPRLPAGSWAVILDADETVLDNSLYQAERAQAGLGYSEESWAAWVKRREATPVPGAAAFLARVHELGGRIAIVTNRLQSVCDDTRAVFARYSLVYDAMLCRIDGTPSDKNPRFQDVASGRSPAGSSPLNVVAYIGDNILDFPGLSQSIRPQPGAFSDFGVRYFLLPNPMYGSWQ
jgi:5'-nucleotidase (lipoprotein e(P4) family)